MARRITRKELKHDEFVDAAFDFGHWLEQHWADVLKWTAGGVLLVVIALAWIGVARQNRIKTEGLLAEGVRRYEVAGAAGFSDPNQLGQALETFDEVIDQAGKSSAPGRLARFYRGSALFHLGRYEDAGTTFEEVLSVSSTPRSLVGAAQAMLVKSYVASDQKDKALVLLEELSNKEDPAMPADQALLELGRLTRAAGNEERAREYFQRVVDEFPDSAGALEARQLLNS